MNDYQALPHSDLSRKVLGAAFEVHTRIGPGLLENSYRACLAHEMRLRGIPFATEAPLPLQYKDCRVDTAYRADMLVAGCLIVELKAVEQLIPLHAAQVLTYLRLARLPVGLLINFNVGSLRAGIRRIVNRRAIEESAARPSA